MKLLVTGSNGQVGGALVEGAEIAGVGVTGLDRARLDITDQDAVHRAIEEHQPDIVVNAAAYTSVDGAEDEPEKAFLVNRDGARFLARACSDAYLPLIHLSTDYVFDGKKAIPYSEFDHPHPLGIYGRSKWEGEEAVRATLHRHIILRTSWVFSPRGSNFVRTMLRLALEQDELRVVSDQRGCPTPAEAIADAILTVSREVVGDEERWGTYHFAGQPAATWHSFAEAVVGQAGALGRCRATRVIPITTSQHPTRARRPMHSVLSTEKIEATFGISPPDWRASLLQTVSFALGGP